MRIKKAPDIILKALLSAAINLREEAGDRQSMLITYLKWISRLFPCQVLSPRFLFRLIMKSFNTKSEPTSTYILVESWKNLKIDLRSTVRTWVKEGDLGLLVGGTGGG